MGSRSIFADESGDESAREGRTDERPPSVFRRRDDGTGRGDGTERTDREDPRGIDDPGAREDRASDDGATMRVFSGDEVYELAVDDAE